MPANPLELTPVVDLTQEKGTGPVRGQRPIYVDLTPPCNHACPAGEDIQAWLAKAQSGHFREAWEILVRDNPLPSVHGRVCYHPCEGGCNRQYLDSSVSIHAVERFLGDLAAEQQWALPIQSAPSGKKVLVVGAGPSGLSAAYHLARMGHSVEIHEAGPVAGGMMQFGIPAYRLPREDLQREVDRIAAMGVKMVFNHRVEDLMAERREGAFDAVFVAVGAQVGKHVDIPARDAPRVLDAISLLHQVSGGEQPQLGRRVVVYGGGNTAMDTARTARRLGAEEALIIYHRDRKHMSAHAFEAEEAESEGVRIKWLSSIKLIEGNSLKVEIMTLDADGRPQPTGEFETLEADSVILALGQQTDIGFLQAVPGVQSRADGTVEIGPNMMTGCPGLFAGGDVVPGERSVTVAVGQGKRAARHIDAWLRGLSQSDEATPPVVDFAMLHLPVFNDIAGRSESALDLKQREGNFDEVVSGLSKEDALYESQRCLSCGRCYECDNCYAACPENAIIKLGPDQGYRYDYSLCTGCAVCFEQCPCHAIEMIPEPAA